jgi:hypothetical protein
VQLDQLVASRAARDREAAPPVLRQHDVQVLAGDEMKLFVRGQPQEHCHHFRCEAMHALDAARQALYHHFRQRRTDLAHFDRQIFVGGVRLAQQHVTVPLFVFHQAEWPAARIGNASCANARAARRAVPALAAVRQVQSRAQRRVEDRFSFFDEDDLLRGKEGDARIGHHLLRSP